MESQRKATQGRKGPESVQKERGVGSHEETEQAKGANSGQSKRKVLCMIVGPATGGFPVCRRTRRRGNEDEETMRTGNTRKKGDPELEMHTELREIPQIVECLANDTPVQNLCCTLQICLDQQILKA